MSVIINGTTVVVKCKKERCVGWVACNSYCALCDRKKSYFTGLSYTRLSAHPNISPILHHFTDETPVLPDASTSYPDALPCSSGGLARNRTMFLVMPRFETTCIHKICPHQTLNVLSAVINIPIF